ncbi:RNA polymerase sigma factor [Candidatus Gracilibacteria bacterium]|nr:RNA polymerase sigma factor [Candidatus Gracilibacteria bacterium]
MNAVPTTLKGDDQLLAVWFELYHAALFRYLLRLVSEAETTADLLQDTFVRALLALNPAQPPDNPSAWLYRIATNLAYNHLRRQRRWRWLSLQALTHTTSFEANVIQAQIVRDCLARLRPGEAEVLLLHEYVGLTSFDIATLSGEKASTIRVRLARACARFSQLYEKEQGAGGVPMRPRCSQCAPSLVSPKISNSRSTLVPANFVRVSGALYNKHAARSSTYRSQRSIRRAMLRQLSPGVSISSARPLRDYNRPASQALRYWCCLLGCWGGCGAPLALFTS